MRLCLIVPGFSADDRDWCVPAVTRLVRRLSRRHSVTVVALRYPHRNARYRAHGARVRSLGGADGTGLRRVVLLERAVAAIRREHHGAAFDLVHGLWIDEAGFVATVSARLLGLPALGSLMGGELVGFRDIGYGVQLGRTGRWLVRRSLSQLPVITAGSSAVEEMILSHGFSGRAERAPLGVDAEAFSVAWNLATLPGRPSLLHVASLVPVKNQHLLLRAFRGVADALPHAHLHLVGSGPLRGELEAHAADLGLRDRAGFHGAVPHDELLSYYRAADIHVTSSRFESQGMAVLEAAACGTGTVGIAYYPED